MKIRLFIVGKTTCPWTNMATQEYLKRFTKEYSFQTIEILNSKKDKEAEGEAILKHLEKNEGLTFALDEHGRDFSTYDLKDILVLARQNGQNLNFIIGGTDGLSPNVLKAAQHVFCLSKLTFPQKIAKLVLIEQLYRATTIIANHPYHRI